MYKYAGFDIKLAYKFFISFVHMHLPKNSFEGPVEADL